MATIATELNIKRESSFTTTRPLITLPSKKLEEILHPFRGAQVPDQFELVLLYAILLHDLAYIPYAFLSEEEIETQIIEIPINYQEFYNISDILRPWFKREKEPKELEQEALLAIASEFSQIEKVQSIYIQKYREELQIQILLSIAQYESDLMDILLDIEYDIRKRYPEIVFEFFYPPAGISRKEDFIHPRAQCIYSR